jgi:hypothetical protein
MMVCWWGQVPAEETTKAQATIAASRAADADVTIPAPPGWVPGNVTQCEDRAHWLGQKECVLVQHLVLEGSVDVDVARALVEKQEVIDRVLDVKPAATSLVPSSGPVAAVPSKTITIDERSEPVVPVRGITAKRAELMTRAAELTPQNREAIHTALKMLAGVCDGALKRDEMGFNGCDSMIGHDLAGRLVLTPLQAALGAKIICKFSRQLGADILEAADPVGRAQVGV